MLSGAPRQWMAVPPAQRPGRRGSRRRPSGPARDSSRRYDETSERGPPYHGEVPLQVDDDAWELPVRRTMTTVAVGVELLRSEYRWSRVLPPPACGA